MFNIKKSVKDLNFHSVKETFIMALNSYQVTVHGTAGLLCSNVQNSDPLGEGAKQKAFYSSKKKKNDCDSFYHGAKLMRVIFVFKMFISKINLGNFAIWLI